MTNAEAVVDMNSEVLKKTMEAKYYLEPDFQNYGNHCVIPQFLKSEI